MPTIRIEEKDYLAANILHGGRNLTAIMVMGLILCAMSLVLFFTAKGQYSDNTTLLLGFALVAIPALQRFVLLPNRLKNIYRQQKDLHRPFAFEWNDTGYALESDHGSSRVPWSDVVRWREDKTVIIIYRSDVLFNLVPKRDLGPAELETFRALLIQKIGAENTPPIKNSILRNLLIWIVITLVLVFLFELYQLNR